MGVCKMKKLISLLMVLMMTMALMVGCGGNDAPEEPEEEVIVEEQEEEEEVEASIVKLGLGQKISIAKSRDADDETTARAQADVTMAAVGFDEEGKVVSVSIDVAQTRVEFDEDLQVASDVEEAIKTKKELQDDYGMKRVSNIEKEWFEQIEALEEWMVGKTVEEIMAMDVKVVDDAHQHVPDVAELTSSVTITVESYLAAVEEAWANAVEVEGAETVGLGVKTSIGKSRGLDGETMPRAQVDTYMAATAFDGEGNVVGTIIDTAQVRVDFDEEGLVTSDRSLEGLTKKELQDDYGMKRVSNIEKEWFEQIEALEEWMVGKTVEEIMAMDVKVVDDAHQHVPDVAELTSSVTITVEGYLAVVEKSFNNAK